MFIKLVHRDTMSVEATVRRVPNGDLLLLCSCGGTAEPAIENRTYMWRSTDSGRTWSKKQQIHEEDGLAHYQTETAVIGDEVRVFISTHNGKFIEWKNYYLSSFDSGYTWQKHTTPCIPEYAFVRGMTKLSNGDIIFPYHSYPITKEQEKHSKENNIPAYNNDIETIENGLIVSSDGGKTFRKQVAFYNSVAELKAQGYWHWNWNENTVVELESPGHLAMLYRIDRSGWLWRSDSFDYGKTWSNTVKTDIPNPSNKPYLTKAPNGDIILLNTPTSVLGLENRFPLEVWLSNDNMKTWYKKIRVSNLPGAYSYANGFVENGHLLMAFEFNRHDIYFVDCNLYAD